MFSGTALLRRISNSIQLSLSNHSFVSDWESSFGKYFILLWSFVVFQRAQLGRLLQYGISSEVLDNKKVIRQTLSNIT